MGIDITFYTIKYPKEDVQNLYDYAKQLGLSDLVKTIENVNQLCLFGSGSEFLIPYFGYKEEYSEKEITKEKIKELFDLLKDILSECEDILFKFRKVTAESILPKFTENDTLETVLYYLEPGNFVFQVLKQMGAQVRVSMLSRKKSLFGKEKESYVTKYIGIKELVSISEEDKKKLGVVIQELKGSKLALLTV